MHRLVLCALALTACHRAPAVPPKADPESGQGRAEQVASEVVGQPAPAATLRTLEGEQLRLGDEYGRRPVYLKFWATWCKPCRAQMPGFVRDHQRLKDQVAFVAVNAGLAETEADVRAARDEFGLRMPVVIDDGALSEALHLRVTPMHVIIGRDGRVAFVGHLDDARLQAALETAVAQTPSQPTRSTPTPSGPARLTTTTGESVDLMGPSADGRARVLVFFSPWCESYLAQTRPKVAQGCRAVREQTNRLAPGSKARWLAVASGLWASAKDLADYQHEPGSVVPLALDVDGAVFHAFGVRDFPAVLIVDAHGRVVRRLGPDDDLAAALADAT